MGLWTFLAVVTAALTAVLPDGRWAQVLDDLDAARNAAYVNSEPARLEQVYTPGSPELAADRQVLAAYAARGLRVDRVSLQLLRVQVLQEKPDGVRLRVVDVLRPVRVRTDDGGWRDLPRDEPTVRTIALRLTQGGWRIARIRRVAG